MGLGVLCLVVCWWGRWGKMQQILLANWLENQNLNALACKRAINGLAGCGGREGSQFELGAMASWCLFLVVNVIVCSVLSSGLPLGSPSSDVAALQELLRKWKATARPDVFENWRLDEDSDPCKERWNGVVCNPEKSAIHLYLNGANLSGGIPPAIGALEELIILDLSGNPLLSSSIPSEHQTAAFRLFRAPSISIASEWTNALAIFFTYIALACVALVAVMIITFCVCRWRSVRKTKNDTFLMTPAPPIAATSFQSRRICASEENEGAEQNP